MLKKAFPQARFILTVREPGAWVNSQINDEAAYQNEPYVEAWDALFGGFSFPPEEIPLARMGHYTLQGYLSFYSNYYQDAIDTLPPDRTLVVRTSRITQCADSIADFTGYNVNVRSSHKYSRQKKLDVAELVGHDHYRQMIDSNARKTWHAIRAAAI